jgi:hypothetical protein
MSLGVVCYASATCSVEVHDEVTFEERRALYVHYRGAHGPPVVERGYACHLAVGDTVNRVGRALFTGVTTARPCHAREGDVLRDERR